VKPVAYVTAWTGARSGLVSVFGSELREPDREAARAAALEALGRWGAALEEMICVQIQQPLEEPGVARVGGGALRDGLKRRARAAQAAAESLLQARGYTTRRRHA